MAEPLNEPMTALVSYESVGIVIKVMVESILKQKQLSQQGRLLKKKQSKIWLLVIRHWSLVQRT